MSRILLATSGWFRKAVGNSLPPASARPSVRWGLLFFLSALVLRAGWTAVAQSIDPVFGGMDPLWGDAFNYDSIAQSLASGQGFQEYGRPTAFRPPGYPFFLAIMYKIFSRDFLAVKIAQALMGSATVVIIAFLGYLIGGKRVGLLAGVASTLSPHLIYFTPWLLSEVPFLFLWVIGLLMLVRLLRRWEVKTAVIAGVALGLATLLRPPTLMPVLFWSVSLVWLAARQGHRRRVAIGFTFLLSAILIILPWTARNYLVFGAFIPVSTNAGLVFYGANNPEAMGGQREGFPPHIRGLSDPELEREYFRLGLEWIRTNPGDFLVLLPKKLLRLWSPLSVGGFEESVKTPFDSLIYPGWLLFLCLSAIGLLLVTKYEVNTALILYIVPLVTTNITSLIFFGGTRYALPMIPPLILFASVAVNLLILKIPLHRDGSRVSAPSQASAEMQKGTTVVPTASNDQT